jgi:hypothetical protein
MMQQMLLTGSGISATLPPDLLVWDTDNVPSGSLASFTLNAAGTYTSVGNTNNVSGTWAIGGSAADYQFRLTVVSGSFGGASTGIWVGPSASPTWSVTQAGASPGGDTFAEGTLEIRSNATGQVFTSSNLTLQAEVFP